MVSLSIIVPVFNKVKYIDECIESIRNQTFTDFELILVNDGASDGSELKCQAYAAQDSRIIVINQENQGVSAARNAGLQIAKGQFIGFVDADDSIAPDMYALLLENAQQTQSEISCCRLNVIKDGKKSFFSITGSRQVYTRENALVSFFKGHFDFNLNNKVYLASVLQGLAFEGSMYEDISFVFSSFLKADVVVLENTPKYNYILRDNSVSMGHFSPAYFETAAVSARILALLPQENLVAIAEAKAFDVMANLSLLNLLLLIKDKSGYVRQFDQIVARLSSYHTFITNGGVVRKKHKYAWLFFKISPRMYAGALRIFCKITQSDAIKRTR